VSTASNPQPTHDRREMVMISVLVEHPTEGLILFEVGPGQDYPSVWGPQLCDVFARIDYSPDQELDAQIAKTGHNIKDIKAVIMGHLHLDHAGGLAFFKDTNVPIYVHEEELKNAFYSVATKSDLGKSAVQYEYSTMHNLPLSAPHSEVCIDN
jgi:glyoxylase-like metal-dependent hydrolase (beta-lactamase superfamily II)